LRIATEGLSSLLPREYFFLAKAREVVYAPNREHMSADIDLTVNLDTFERLLKHGDEPEQRQKVLETLLRWQYDQDLNDISRQRSCVLLHRFAPHLL